MIREGQLKDLDKIESLVKRAKEKMLEEGNDQWDDTYPKREHYEDDLRHGRLFVYEEKGRILGAACISDTGHSEYDEIDWKTTIKPYLCMKRLAVDPTTRQRGIGLKFYQFAEELAKDREVPSLRTDTNGANKAALRLFEKAGYSFVTAERHGHYKEPFVYYEKVVGK
ncbi:GNAT family N-acetyltransferase [Tenuibacillus multivorans]|uniref:Ribosomal protein S18 acetylase RimI n=1 Tax=Tenuibacillus multivorans TaxID=237069 RepID=A0A1H0B8S9_9BACI|nr:GNAT family N-acetyltransferase [Tenuibacillus multivorans]GEL78599.1 N-acetyltransferase [Tenuibacillus multivorans]SDN42039.1 Ribosomal protein S18 acetylase RimI [Tenuibacillus multivorans]